MAFQGTYQRRATIKVLCVERPGKQRQIIAVNGVMIAHAPDDAAA
jgi:hypothetical protein